MNIINLIGLAFVFFFILILVAVYFLLEKRKGSTLREIAAFYYLQRAIGLSVEDGKRIHLALGWGNLFEEPFSSGLIGLNILERLTRVALFSDNPPMATSGNGGLMLLSQDTIRHSYRSFGLSLPSQIYESQMIGVTPFSYAIATHPLIKDEKVSVDVLLGHFNSELGLIMDASARQNNLSIGGSENLTAQAVFYGVSNYPLIGEEVYAAGAYMGSNRMHKASIQVQDYFRWGIIFFILIGIALKVLGIL
ncbi:MAG: DUF6754 domain-containing protein [Anaerolineales bacterium]